MLTCVDDEMFRGGQTHLSGNPKKLVIWGYGSTENTDRNCR